jgi:hypothetical protein
MRPTLTRNPEAMGNCQDATKKELRDAEIALLRQKIVEAKQRGDVQRLVRLKTYLYDRYRIGSI